MTTPKPFNPVVTEDMLGAYILAAGESGHRLSGVHAAMTHPDFQRQLREYAASVARQMVPDKAMLFVDYTPDDVTDASAFNRCRAEMLARIEAYVGEGM